MNPIPSTPSAQPPPQLRPPLTPPVYDASRLLHDYLVTYMGGIFSLKWMKKI
jgi:hypothetical protein